MLTTDESKADYYVDTKYIPLEKADSLKVSCFPVKKYKCIEVGEDTEEDKLAIDVYCPWNKMDRIGGN